MWVCVDLGISVVCMHEQREDHLQRRNEHAKSLKSYNYVADIEDMGI